MNQRFAGKFFPIRHALAKLPDADGVLRSYVRKSTAGVGQKQPQSHGKIVRALRRGDGSRQEQALTSQERAIYNQIRTTLAGERQNSSTLGSMLVIVARTTYRKCGTQRKSARTETRLSKSSSSIMSTSACRTAWTSQTKKHSLLLVALL